MPPNDAPDSGYVPSVVLVRCIGSKIICDTRKYDELRNSNRINNPLSVDRNLSPGCAGTGITVILDKLKRDSRWTSSAAREGIESGCHAAIDSVPSSSSLL